MTWQPIATAPKDGSNVIVFAPQRWGVVVACWDGWNWITRPGRINVGPTHWMPVPAAPPEQA